MYTNNRNAYRQAFFIAWDKHKKKLPLEPVEAQLVEVILLHPEYHAFLDKPDTFENQEFELEENPFFHMSLHLTLLEQIRMDRPAGIALIHQQLIEKYQNPHNVMHRMMQCLAQLMWQAQQNGEMASEENYLQRLRNI